MPNPYSYVEQNVNVDQPLPAGANLIGAVKIDQTTPGTTNAVALKDGSGSLVYNPPFHSLSGVLVIGAGTAWNIATARAAWALQVVVSGAPDTCVVVLEGSLDGTHYFTLATWDVTAPLNSGDIVFAAGKPVSKVRAHLTTLSGGTAPAVDAYIAAV